MEESHLEAAPPQPPRRLVSRKSTRSIRNLALTREPSTKSLTPMEFLQMSTGGGGEGGSFTHYNNSRNSRNNRRGMLSRQESEDGFSFFSDGFESKKLYEEEEENHQEEPKIATMESRFVFWLRILVLLSLTVSGVFVTVIVYLLAKDSGETSCYDPFPDYAKQVFESIQETLQTRLVEVDSFSAELTSYAQNSGSNWPEVTFPNFERRGQELLAETRARSVSFHPVVIDQTRAYWDDYAHSMQGWLNESLAYRGEPPILDLITMDLFSAIGIKTFRSRYLPFWQVAPVHADISVYNMDMNGQPAISDAFDKVLENRTGILSAVAYPNDYADDTKTLEAFQLDDSTDVAALYYPIYEEQTENAPIVAVLITLYDWSSFFAGVDPPIEMSWVVENAFNDTFTYRLLEDSVDFMGLGDLHNTAYDDQKETFFFNGFASPGDLNASNIGYSLSVYPTYGIDDICTASSNNNLFYTILTALLFVGCIVFFLAYNWTVERRQKLVVTQAMQSKAIVSSLFPEQVHHRLMETAGNETNQEENRKEDEDTDSEEANNKRAPSMNRIASWVSKESTPDTEAAPIADLYPNCTVMFADIAGFTAWSSTRDPIQVFTLLQGIYGEFDKAARKRNVFKVETIGDCYVAVTGLPEAQEKHALIMAGFALECRKLMQIVCSRLEVKLGPDTTSLCLRVGLHSGPVTAGVLRGEKSRFQLFGDTVNTASRMESTGKIGQIQVSGSTASLLQEAGKGEWLIPRTESVSVKGKGEMETFWFEAKVPKRRNRRVSVATAFETFANESGADLNFSDHEAPHMFSQRELLEQQASQNWGRTQLREARAPSRMIEWNVELLLGLLKKVVAKRQSTELDNPSSSAEQISEKKELCNGATFVDEVKEIISLPAVVGIANTVENADPDSVQLGQDVECQLREYVKSIAGMYRDNPFHNYEHACHVQLAIVKLLQRIESDVSDTQSYARGIASDPLTQFACVFCALIHDVDHTGVSNAQLVKEDVYIAKVFKGKSVAEQNSIDLAWNMLMEDKYKDLRGCLYKTQCEFDRFRQLVINVVLATDIFDKDLSTMRKKSWAKAFDDEPIDDEATFAEWESTVTEGNRKATIVIEHLIQASDVSHTMQHWDIFLKWNERLFSEMYSAYKSGRTDQDPSKFWFKGELWFFDNYVIPLAMKLKDCGVFGVSPDECLNYATENRALWEAKGEEIVADMLEFQNEGTNKRGEFKPRE